MPETEVKIFSSPAWSKAIGRYLQGQKEIHSLKYSHIQQKLSELGIQQSTANLGSKFNRGNLGAQLFCAVLLAMGETQVDLKEIERLVKEELSREE